METDRVLSESEVLHPVLVSGAPSPPSRMMSSRRRDLDASMLSGDQATVPVSVRSPFVSVLSTAYPWVRERLMTMFITLRIEALWDTLKTMTRRRASGEHDRSSCPFARLDRGR